MRDRQHIQVISTNLSSSEVPRCLPGAWSPHVPPGRGRFPEIPYSQNYHTTPQPMESDRM